MSGTEAQKDKCSAGGQPDTPAGKLRGRIGNLQVTNAANEARKARQRSMEASNKVGTRQGKDKTKQCKGAGAIRRGSQRCKQESRAGGVIAENVCS